MIEVLRLKRNEDKLGECHPVFGALIKQVVRRVELLGYRPRIQEAWRSPAEQEGAFRSGHSHLEWGYHNATSPTGSPEALAVDILDDDYPLASRTSYLLVLAAAATDLRLTTGITWGLPPALAAAVERAYQGALFQAPVKLGWDPTHVQVTGITVEEARKGARPDPHQEVLP